MIPETEWEMVRAAEVVLVRKDVEYATEVPLMHRSIDLVFRDGDEFVAVEFKRHDWRRGLAQARDHALAVDRVYLCLPSERVTKALRREAAEAGVGVLGWSPQAPLSEAVAAQRSDLVWTVSRRWLEARFEFCRSRDE